jgi:hypothetical protein
MKEGTHMDLLARRCSPFALAAACAVAAASPAFSQVLLNEDFEDFDASGWTANGVVTIVEGNGNPGNSLGLPYKEFFGVSLSAREPASMVLGDLTAVGPIRLTTDVQVFQAHTWNNDELDLSQWPMVFELVDYGDPKTGRPYASVYTIQGHWPQQRIGWTTVSFELPDPSREELPFGWGGTGDSDPVTGEPILPPGTTYRDVLSSVDEVRVTTYVPGYFYTGNFWEVGFDNVRVEAITGVPCRADFNEDQNVNSQDFFDFLNAFFSQQPSADFNGDGGVNSQDFFDFLGAFFAGC